MINSILIQREISGQAQVAKKS